MTLTSADFAHGTPVVNVPPSDLSGAEDLFQEVPLHSSSERNGSKTASTSAKLKGAAGAQSDSPDSPVDGKNHLHFPQQFPVPRMQELLIVRVHSPETASQSVILGFPATYTVYTVETQSKLKDMYPELTTVKRRFRDFEALHLSLRARFPGRLIPMLPQKHLLQGKLLSDEAFLTRRAQDLEVFVNRCANQPSLQRSQMLLLFLTLETDSLPDHAYWKDAAAGNAELEHFRHAPQLPDVFSAPRPKGGKSSSTLGYLGTSILGGVRQLGHRVKAKISADPGGGAPSPEVDHISALLSTAREHAHAASALVHGATMVGHAQEVAGAALCAAAEALKRAGAPEATTGPASAAAATSCCRFAYAARAAGIGYERHGRAADAAVAPLRHVESGRHSAVAALEDRLRLAAGIDDSRRQAQERREALRGFHAEADGTEGPRSGEALEVAKAIQALDVRVKSMQGDYSQLCSRVREEEAALRNEVNMFAPLAVMQYASLSRSLMDMTATQWEALAENLSEREE